MVPVEVASQIEQSLSVMVRALSDPEILVAPQTEVLLGETDAEAPPMRAGLSHGIDGSWRCHRQRR